MSKEKMGDEDFSGRWVEVTDCKAPRHNRPETPLHKLEFRCVCGLRGSVVKINDPKKTVKIALGTNTLPIRWRFKRVRRDEVTVLPDQRYRAVIRLRLKRLWEAIVAGILPEQSSRGETQAGD